MKPQKKWNLKEKMKSQNNEIAKNMKSQKKNVIWKKKDLSKKKKKKEFKKNFNSQKI